MPKRDRGPVRLAKPGGDDHTEMNRAAAIILERELLTLYPELMQKAGTSTWAQTHVPRLFREVKDLELSIEALWSSACPLPEFQAALCRGMDAVLAMFEARWLAGQGEGMPAGSSPSSPHPSSVSERAVQSSLFKGLEAS